MFKDLNEQLQLEKEKFEKDTRQSERRGTEAESAKESAKHRVKAADTQQGTGAASTSSDTSRSDSSDGVKADQSGSDNTKSDKSYDPESPPLGVSEPSDQEEGAASNAALPIAFQDNEEAAGLQSDMAADKTQDKEKSLRPPKPLGEQGNREKNTKTGDLVLRNFNRDSSDDKSSAQSRGSNK
jgi:hypothetical protein